MRAAAGRGGHPGQGAQGPQGHDEEVHRVRQEHPRRLLLPAVQAHGHRQDAGARQAAQEAVRARRQPAARGLQERLLQRRGRDELRLQGEVPHHEAVGEAEAYRRRRRKHGDP